MFFNKEKYINPFKMVASDFRYTIKSPGLNKLTHFHAIYVQIDVLRSRNTYIYIHCLCLWICWGS